MTRPFKHIDGILLARAWLTLQTNVDEQPVRSVDLRRPDRFTIDGNDALPSLPVDSARSCSSQVRDAARLGDVMTVI